MKATMGASTATMKKLQASSGLVMGCFLVMHLFNHYMLNVSYDTADTWMMKFRLVYRVPLFEITFFGAMVVHFCANVALYRNRSKLEAARHEKQDDRPNTKVAPGTSELKAHRIAGYILSVLVLVHANATRLTPLLYFDNPSVFDYSFGAIVIPLVPFHLFSIYYAILGMAGGWHLVYGTRAALATLAQDRSVIGKAFPLPLKMVALTNHFLVVGAVVAMGRYAVELDWPPTKQEMHNFFLEVMGM